MSIRERNSTEEATIGSNEIMRESGVKKTSLKKENSEMNSFINWVESI